MDEGATGLTAPERKFGEEHSRGEGGRSMKRIIKKRKRLGGLKKQVKRK